jgi:hypothetical protein
MCKRLHLVDHYDNGADSSLLSQPCQQQGYTYQDNAQDGDYKIPIIPVAIVFPPLRVAREGFI